jgi:hypothetical protein
LRKEDRVIARIWHGYTKPEHANAYQAMLKAELLPGISKVKGCRGSYLVRFEPIPARIPHNPCGFGSELLQQKYYAWTFSKNRRPLSA